VRLGSGRERGRRALHPVGSAPSPRVLRIHADRELAFAHAPGHQRRARLVLVDRAEPQLMLRIQLFPGQSTPVHICGGQEKPFESLATHCSRLSALAES
jgi:hypothetical protein